jgi:hypothetical protein
LYFFPLPHGQGSLRPTFGSSRLTVLIAASSPPTRAGCLARDPSAALARVTGPANAATGSSAAPL